MTSSSTIVENETVQQRQQQQQQQPSSSCSCYCFSDENDGNIQPTACCCSINNNSSRSISISINNNCNNTEWTEANIIETVQLWELTTEETRKLLALRDRLADMDDYPHKNNPFQVVRFLRFQRFHTDAAERMFRDMVKWRKSVMRVDELMEHYHPPEELLQYYPGAILQGVVDHDGDPVYVGRLGVLDGEGLVKRFGKESVLQHTLWMREQMTDGPWIQHHCQQQQQQQQPLSSKQTETTTTTQKPKRTFCQITVVEDLEGLGLHHVTNRQLVAMFGQVMEWDQKYYPEITKRVILIRAPPIFCALWQVVKHFFDPYFVQEMMIVAGRNNYIETLEQYLNPEILPKELMAPELSLGQGKAVSCMSPYFKGGKVPRQRKKHKQSK